MAKNRKTPDMNLPVWFDGQNINEALFCEEFLQESRIIFANRAFFTPNGRVTDDIVLRGEVYEKLKSYTISSVPQKIKNIMELLKLEAMVEDLPPQPDRIHVANGTLMLDGRFIEGKKEIVQSRLPVSYNPNAAVPQMPTGKCPRPQLSSSGQDPGHPFSLRAFPWWSAQAVCDKIRRCGHTRLADHRC